MFFSFFFFSFFFLFFHLPRFLLVSSKWGLPVKVSNLQKWKNSRFFFIFFFHFFSFLFSFASVFAGFVQMRFASEGFKPPKMKKTRGFFHFFSFFFHFFFFFHLPRFLLVSSKWGLPVKVSNLQKWKKLAFFFFFIFFSFFFRLFFICLGFCWFRPNEVCQWRFQTSKNDRGKWKMKKKKWKPKRKKRKIKRKKTWKPKWKNMKTKINNKFAKWKKHENENEKNRCRKWKPKRKKIEKKKYFQLFQSLASRTSHKFTVWGDYDEPWASPAIDLEAMTVVWSHPEPSGTKKRLGLTICWLVVATTCKSNGGT